jgi:hypothetical protein
MGNHDYDASRETEALTYFTGLSQNNNSGKTYYSKVIGNIEFFFLDDNPEHPDNATGINASAANFQASVMGQWLINKIAASTAAWKVLVTHHPVWTDSSDDASPTTVLYPALDWNWAGMGIHLVIQGHAHGVERIYKNGIFYYLAAMGGGQHHNWGTKQAHTEFRIEDTSTTNTGNGFLKIAASATQLLLDYYHTDTTRLDRTVIRQA